jgi:mono/diheme cytochrome c family protein
MPNFRRVSAVACAGLLAVAGVVYVAKAMSAPPQGSTEDVYLDKCSVCHGKDGAAKTAKGKKVKAKDVRETMKTMSEDDMIKVVNDGKGKDMDSFKKELSKEQIKQLVEYYRSLAAK